MWSSTGETHFMFFNNYDGNVCFTRPFDYGRAVKRTTRRVRKKDGTAKAGPDPDLKPQPLIKMEAAWCIQRLVRPCLARYHMRMKYAEKLHHVDGRKLTENWIAFDDPVGKWLYGKQWTCYCNLETRRVVWQRFYETVKERQAREKREAIALQLKLNTEMIEYGRVGNVVEARRRVRQGANIYYFDEEHGCTLGHFASARSLMNVLVWLQKESFNFAFKDRLRATCLHYAAKSGNEQCLQFLLGRPEVNIEAKDNRGRTPLLWASFGAQVFAIDMLRDAGADLHAMDHAGCTAVHRAANSPIAGRRTETISWLQAEGLDVHHKDNWGWTPVNKAYTCKAYEVARELVRHGCDLTVDGSFAKNNKFGEGSFEKIEGWEPVHVAALQGRTQALEYLVKRGCELDVPDKRGETPLHLAAGNGHLETVKYLLRQGCSISARNNINQTPSMVAKRLGHDNCIEVINVVEERLARLESKKSREKQKMEERGRRKKK